MTPLPPNDILDNLETAVVVLDSNLLITALNPAAENLLGISRNRAVSTPLLPLVDEDETLKRVLANSLVTNQTYAHELLLAPSEVHAASRMVECRVTPVSQPRPTLLARRND